MAIDLGLVTAYAYAVAGGYEGTEAEFEQLLGDIANDLSEIENLSVVANTLPAGSSATASYSDGVLTLGIPRGDTGATGAGATVAAGTTTTGAEGTNASVTNSGTSKDAVFNFTIPRGNTGNGIDSIYLTGTSGAVKTYTILFTDGNTTTFEVTDGEVTEAQLESVLEDYARIDGYYEDLTAGYAENLISNVYDEENVPYNFRTAGGSLDIGSFEYDEVVGGTVAVNQIMPALSDLSATRCTKVVSGNTATLTVDASGISAGRMTISKSGLTTIPQGGHKYYLSYELKTSVALSNSTIQFGNSLSVTSGAVSTLNTWQTFAGIKTQTAPTGAYVQDDIYGTFTTGNTVQIRNSQIIDLTLLFGTTIADYIYTLEQGNAGAGVAWFKKLFPKSYYPYNAGSLEHVQTSGHKMVGFNAYNPTAGTAKLVGGMEYEISGTYSSVSYTDISGNAETLSIVGGKFTPTNNGTLTVTGGNATNTCVHLVWDGERDGEYEAYKEYYYPLDSTLVLRGKPYLDSANRLKYDGDIYNPNGTVTRKYGERAYQSGDESLADAITDGTTTVYKLTTPTTETADAFQSPQSVSNWGTEEYIDTRSIPIPVGHNTKYPPDLKAKLETSPNPPDADGDYIVRQTNGVNEYVALSTNATIQNIISRLEALEG